MELEQLWEEISNHCIMQGNLFKYLYKYCFGVFFDKDSFSTLVNVKKYAKTEKGR